MPPQPDSLQDFDRARRKALVQDVLGLIAQKSSDLLPFEEVRRQLRLQNSHFVGLQEVPLDQIVGSVGRYRDFTRTFLPRRDELRQRWASVEDQVKTGGLPPVKLYQVGDTYYVLDGNHRISIARAQDASSIEAYVWEFETGVRLNPGLELDDLLIKAEYAEFLRRTRLDKSWPEQRIEFTTPGRYVELEYQIALYRYNLSQIDGEEISFPGAAALWYDLFYLPLVQIIQDSGARHEFPGRTEADLFVWLLRYQRELSERYGRQESMSNAAADFARRFSQQPIKKLTRQIKRTVKGPGEEAFDELEGDLT